MEGEYVRVRSDYDDDLAGYFGFQVLEDGTKAVIMSLWNAFCEDEAGNVNQVKGKVLFPEEVGGNDFTPENNGEGSWNFGQDERCCWIITSGIHGLCAAPESLGPYPIPATESGAPD